MSISRRLLLKALFSRNPGKVLATAGWGRTDVDGVKAGYAFARAALGTDGLLGPAGSGAQIRKTPRSNTASPGLGLSPANPDTRAH